MTEQERSRREALARMLADCAGGVETATVGIIGIVLPIETLDEQTSQIQHELLDLAHRLRLIASALPEER